MHKTMEITSQPLKQKTLMQIKNITYIQLEPCSYETEEFKEPYVMMVFFNGGQYCSLMDEKEKIEQTYLQIKILMESDGEKKDVV